MKLLFLNTWYATRREQIKDFLQQYAAGVDIFCLQEVENNMRELCRTILPKHNELFAHKTITGDNHFEQAIYIRPGLEVLESSTVIDKLPLTGLGLYAAMAQSKGRNLHLCNTHGTSRPGNKLDDPARLQQSQGLIDFFKNKSGPRIIGGDFNLLPDTKSISMFEENGYRNLIKEYGIKNTRNKFAWERYPENPQYFADYIFVSPEVKVKSFQVIDNDVSDHLPLILEIEM